MSHGAERDDDADWRLLAAVGAGDPDAFAPLVERYEGRLFGVCLRLLGDREEARDAAQEVFLRVFRHAADAEPRGAFFTWVYRIAVNHCLNRLRRRRLVRFLSLDAPSQEDEGATAMPEPAGSDPGAEHVAVERERWRATRAALARLPPSQRVVVVLTKLEGLSYRRTAEILGVTEGAVESRLVRAMRTLTAAQEAPVSGVSRGGTT